MVEQWIIDGINAGIRSQKLEGIEFSEEDIIFLNKVKNGEISFEEAERIELEKLKKLKSRLSHDDC